MTSCLDGWQTHEPKKKKKQSKVEVEYQPDMLQMSVESLGKSAAVLLPKEGTADVWTISSEDESEPEQIQSSTPNKGVYRK